MTLVLLILVGIPILWLLSLLFYLVLWFDWDKGRAYVSK
jgi:hypothetical protein